MVHPLLKSLTSVLNSLNIVPCHFISDNSASAQNMVGCQTSYYPYYPYYFSESLYQYTYKNLEWIFMNVDKCIHQWTGSVSVQGLYSLRRLTAKSREIWKPRDWMLWWSYRSDNWQVPWQRCCRCACQISCDWRSLNPKLAASRRHEILR